MAINNELQSLGFSHGMSEAIKIALTTKNFPNPNVGASLISKGGELIAVGFHKGKNTDHAEIDLINYVKNNNISTENAILYVTLEPCMHKDTSPSCAETILLSKMFKNIVIGDIDPDIRTNGKGYQFLADRGVNVAIEPGAMEFLDPAYMNKIETSKSSSIPVLIKAGISNDDFIHSNDKIERYITSIQSRKIAHYLRSTVDGLLIGKNTLIVDNPSLDVRYGINAKHPEVFILWGSDQTLYEKYLNKHPKFNFLIDFDHKEQRSHTLPSLSATNILSYLYKIGIRSLLVEGGNIVWNNFISIAKRIYIFKASNIIERGTKITNNLKSINIKSSYNLTKKIKLSEDTLYIYNKKTNTE